jgi:tight adherence protein B
METKTILLIVMGVVALGAFLAVVFAPTEKEKAAKRASSLGGGVRKADGSASASPDTSKDRRKHVQDSLKKIDEKSKEAAAKKKLSLGQMIEQAGLSISERDFWILSVITALVMVALGFVSAQKPLIIGAMALIGFLGLPRWALGFLRKRRQKQFLLEFVNAIEVIVRGIKSGLPVNECLKIISRDAQEPVKTEFYLMTEGIKLGLSLEQTLERMYDRMPINEVNFFSIVLIIQKQTGGNLAEALGNLSTVLRNRRMMEGKISALSTEAKASAVILGSLPFMVGGMVYMSSPDYLAPLFNLRMGHFMLIGAGIWMSIGIIVMKNMISIKV